MRCSECGYMNDDKLKICRKCGTKLSGAAPAAASGDGKSAAQTVAGEPASAPAWDAKNPVAGKADIIRCPKCDYMPLRRVPSAEAPCINCGFKGEAPAAKQSRDALRTVGIGNLQAYQEKKKPKLWLVRVDDGRAISFEGEKVELNRAAIDPENAGISSKIHARITHEAGGLMLEDCSSNGATFMQVKGKVKVEHGSIIILGDRMYKVESSS